MYTIYDKHIELLEEENAELKEEVFFLKRIVEYYKKNAVDIKNTRIDD